MKNKINKQKKPRILLYDIETAYTVGAVWGLYEQNVATVLRDPYILTVAWKWLGDSKINVMSLPDFPAFKSDQTNDASLVREMAKLFDEADVIIAHNGNGFDQKWTYGRFAVNNIKPPSPSKYVDTLLISRSKFKFNSNKLNDLARYLSIKGKLETGGIDLWVGCIERNDPKSWAKMCRYNKQDVNVLEKVYLRILPFITNHPNLAILNGDRIACPNCGSHAVQKRGIRFDKQMWWCKLCDSWHSSLVKDGSQIR